MFTIGHASDLHGNLRKLFATVKVPSVWVFSGDLFPNSTRGVVEEEVPFQTNWFNDNAEAFIARLGGAPVIWVGGNHDYVNLAKLLQDRGYPAFDLENNPQGLSVLGRRFAGFHQIPWIAGEWRGEVSDFSGLVDTAFQADPEILVTHAPPGGILDGSARSGYGIPAITQALTYQPHRISLHLFGHMHLCGGQEVTEMGIRFCNGAEHVRFIEHD